MEQVIAQAGLVVMIAKKNENTLDFLGSGFVCTERGHILTCAHILDLTAELHIIASPPINTFIPLTSEQVNALPVQIVHIDAENDVALLGPKGDLSASIAPNMLGRGIEINVGQTVGCLGFPFANRGLHTMKLTATLICGKSLTTSGSKRLHLDANMHEGNSGGPVISKQSGQVIAIVSSRFSPVGNGGGVMIGNMPLGADSTISFAVPIEYSFPLLREEGVNV